MSKSPEACPACGSARVLPIVYGSPTAETEQRAARGELVLGGCMVHHDERDPAFACQACGERFEAYNWKGESDV